MKERMLDPPSFSKLHLCMVAIEITGMAPDEETASAEPTVTAVAGLACPLLLDWHLVPKMSGVGDFNAATIAGSTEDDDAGAMDGNR